MESNNNWLTIEGDDLTIESYKAGREVGINGEWYAFDEKLQCAVIPLGFGDQDYIGRDTLLALRCPVERDEVRAEVTQLRYDLGQARNTISEASGRVERLKAEVARLQPVDGLKVGDRVVFANEPDDAVKGTIVGFGQLVDWDGDNSVNRAVWSLSRLRKVSE